MTVEQDWEKGAPYIYRDNKIRAYIEAIEVDEPDEPEEVGGQSSVQPDDAYRVLTEMERNPVVPPSRSGSRRSPSLYMASRGIVPASSLYGTTARPLGPPPTAQGQPPPTGRASQKTLTDLDQWGMSFFEGTPFNKGGIVSIQRKPRQLVG